MTKSTRPQFRARIGEYLRLMRYAAPYRRGWLIIFLTTLLSSGLALLQPWPMKILVDQVLAHHGQAMLVWLVLGGLGIFVAQAFMDAVLTYCWTRIGQGMVFDLAGDLFAKIQRRSLLFHSRNPVGDSMGRVMGDSWCIQKVVNTLLLTPVTVLITMGAAIAVMSRLDGGLTLLALAIAPLMTVASYLLGKPVRAAAIAHRAIESRIQTFLQQTLSGMPVVQAFAQEEREHRRFQEHASAAIRTQQRSTLVGSFSNLAGGLPLAVRDRAVTLLGARHALQGRISLGSILVFLAYLGTLQGQIQALAGVYMVLQGSGANIDRVLEVLSADQEVRDLPGAKAPPASCRGHLRGGEGSFGYEPGRPPVLRGG